jgi:hypothetical protein
MGGNCVCPGTEMSHMRKVVALLIGLICTLSLWAQQDNLDPQVRLLTRFPFKMYSGGVMVVQARVGNTPDTLNFILDTGSGGISLDSATCSDLKIPIVPSDTIISGIAGMRKVPFAFDKTLRLPGLDVEHLNFHVNDYEILSNVYGEKIDGIIGYSFLNRYIVKINFDSVMIEVYSPGDIRYPKGGTLLRPAFTSIPIQWARVKDARKVDFNFYFDTGAGICFLMNEKFAADSNVLLSKRRPVITQAEGMGGKLQMRLTVVRQVKIGPYTFHRVPAYLYTDSFNITSYPFVGGLIGNDLLRRFNMTFNYPKREIHLLPNSHFFEPFDYAYTGLSIYAEAGKVVVEDVIPDSPADKAGMRVGDVLIGVGNNLSNNIMSLKNSLQVPNAKLRLLIMRNEQLMEVILKTGTIL